MGESEILLARGIFLSDCGIMRSEFDQPFSRLKKHYVNIEHRLELTAAWSVYNLYESKIKMVQEQFQLTIV